MMKLEDKVVLRTFLNKTYIEKTHIYLPYILEFYQGVCTLSHKSSIPVLFEAIFWNILPVRSQVGAGRFSARCSSSATLGLIWFLSLGIMQALSKRNFACFI